MKIQLSEAMKDRLRVALMIERIRGKSPRYYFYGLYRQTNEALERRGLLRKIILAPAVAVLTPKGRRMAIALKKQNLRPIRRWGQ